MEELPPENLIDEINAMARRMAKKRAWSEAMNIEQQNDLFADMRFSALKAWTTFDPDKGDWWPRCKEVMRLTNVSKVDSPLSVSRRVSAAARRAVAIHKDDTAAAIEEMVQGGIDRYVAQTVIANMGAPLPLSPDGMVLAPASVDNIPATGRRTTDNAYIDLNVAVESTDYSNVDWSAQRDAFHDTLNEREQMVWNYHLAGMSNAWISDAMDKSESWISEDLNNIKRKWTTFEVA